MMYVEPPITDLFIKDDTLENDLYCEFCIGCENEYIFYPVYVVTCLICMTSFLILTWIVVSSFKKFARDGATLAEEEDGNVIALNDRQVINRIGKTQMRLQIAEEGATTFDQVINNHEELTITEDARKSNRKKCCGNCCRMWNYRKIVSQEE